MELGNTGTPSNNGEQERRQLGRAAGKQAWKQAGGQGRKQAGETSAHHPTKASKKEDKLGRHNAGKAAGRPHHATKGKKKYPLVDIRHHPQSKPICSSACCASAVRRLIASGCVPRSWEAGRCEVGWGEGDSASLAHTNLIQLCT